MNDAPGRTSPGPDGRMSGERPALFHPGVIPLRPLGASEILGGAISSARIHWRTVLGVVLPVALVVQSASTIATGIWMRDNQGLKAIQDTSQASTNELLAALRGLLGGAAVELLASVIGTVIVTAMLTVVVSRAVLGRPSTLDGVWRGARPQMFRLLGLTLLILGLVGGAVFAGLSPGLLLAVTGAHLSGSLLALLGGVAGCATAVWLWIRYCLAAPALMLEKAAVRTALQRSAKLVRGDWWRVLGIQLLALAVVFVLSYLVQMAATAVATVTTGETMGGAGMVDFSVSWSYLVVIGVGAVVSSVLTLPLNAGVTALLYMDQRIRREALDMELARHTRH